LAKKKSKFKKVAITLSVIFVVLLLVLIYGYIDFEFKKLGESGVTPMSDWRSYIAFLLEKVPVINNYVEYTPREIIQPQKYYSEIYETYIQKIEADRKELEKKAAELAEFEEQLNEREAKLNANAEELQLQEERLQSEMQAWESSRERFQKLADWFANGDEAMLAQALASGEIDVEEIVNGLRLIDPGIAADIVGQLATIDENKAAEILANLAGKEVTR